MIDGFKFIIEFIQDKTKHWTIKTAMFVTIFAILIIVDFISKFTYNYHISSKLDDLEKVTILKERYDADSINLFKILQIEKKIFERKHYSEYFFNINLKEQKLPSESVFKNNNEPVTVIKQIKKISRPSYFWMLVSSNLLFIILFPFILFMPLYGSEKISMRVLTNWFATLTVFSIIIIIVTWLAMQIPVINGKPIYNYLINILIHIFVLVGISKLGKNN